MFCPYCGMEIEDNSRFCPYCGEHLDDAVNAPAAPPAPVPEIPGEPVQEAPVQEALPPFAAAPAPEQQPVRFDQTNTYQYRQAYTPENPYYGEPAPVQQEKSGKGGKKTLLWILLGAAAALLVAGAVILAVTLIGRSSGSASSYLIIRTEDDGYYLNDEKTQICGNADDRYLSEDFRAAITRNNGKWYYEKNGERTRIGSSGSSVLRYDGKELSWILYKESSGETYLFRTGEKEDILVFEEDDGQPSRNTEVSNNNKYVAMLATEHGKYVILRVSISSGEIVTIHTDRKGCYVYGVDDKGCVYYIDGNNDYHVADGKDDVILEDIDGMLLLRDLLFCYEVNVKKNTYTYYSRPLGMKGELKPLNDLFPQAFFDMSPRQIIPFARSKGYEVSYGYSSKAASCVIVEYRGDLCFVDLKAETYTTMLEDCSLNEIGAFYLTEDMKTAYVRVDSTLYKLTAGREDWEKEVLSKHCLSIKSFRQAGLIFAEDDGTVVVYDGREAVSYEDLGQYTLDFSEDLKSVVYVNGSKIMYVRRAGEKAERVARDNGGYRAVLFRNHIYYINEDGELVKMKPGGEPEVIMEDVESIAHYAY